MIGKKELLTLFIGLLTVIVVAIVATTIGYANISIVQTFKILINQIYNIFDTTGFPVNSDITILYVRLPRIIGSALAGIGLTISGIVFQSILRNPMAEPYILGVSSGAAVGAAAAITINVTLPIILKPYTTPIFALTLGMLTSLFVIFISGNSYKNNKIILYGVSINFFLSSILTLIISFNHKQSSNIIFWTLGSFSTMNYFKVLIMFIFVFIGILILFYNSKELNLFTMGENVAQTLGLNVHRTRTFLLVSASTIAGIIVAFSGVIGFVGLIIPHLTRIFVGSEHKKVLSLSIPMGAVFMILCDTLARTVLDNELPVGIITSIVGAPLFIYLLKKRGLN